MNTNIIIAITIVVVWFTFLIIYGIISVKKKHKKIAFALIAYINNYKNLLNMLENENVDMSTSEDFNILKEFYDLITQCCVEIELDDEINLAEIEIYEYGFNFRLMRKAGLDLDFIELSNFLLIDFICKLLKSNVIKNENLEYFLKELHYM